MTHALQKPVANKVLTKKACTNHTNGVFFYYETITAIGFFIGYCNDCLESAKKRSKFRNEYATVFRQCEEKERGPIKDTS